MKELGKIVSECICQHEGGEKFFDALDERIRNSEGLLHSMVHMFNGDKFDAIIASGKFGKVFKDFVSECYPKLEVFVVNGSLRKDGVIFTEDNCELDGKTIVFVDDSYYSGTTRRKVEEYVSRCGGKLTNTYVFYDGSFTADSSIKSMYRYYCTKEESES